MVWPVGIPTGIPLYILFNAIYNSSFFIFVNAGMGPKHLVNAVGCPGHRNQIRIFIMCNAYFLLACTVLITQDERNGGVGNGGFGMANPNGEQEGGKGRWGDGREWDGG